MEKEVQQRQSGVGDSHAGHIGPCITHLLNHLFLHLSKHQLLRNYAISTCDTIHRYTLATDTG